MESAEGGGVLTIPISPFSIVVDGVEVEIVEVAPVMSGFYVAVCRVKFEGVVSRNFQLLVRDMEELERKLKVEITKVKYMYYAFGLEELRRRIT